YPRASFSPGSWISVLLFWTKEVLMATIQLSLSRRQPLHKEDYPMQSVISKDGTTIAYDRTGQGPAVILVAGAFSYRKYPGSVQVADLLAQHFTVFNYDRRGRGDSGDTKPYAVEREIEDRSEEHTSELQSRGHLVCRL